MKSRILDRNCSKCLFILLLSFLGLCLHASNDSSLVVRISTSGRYYYGVATQNDSIKGIALQDALTAASPHDVLLMRSSSNGGTFQGNFTTATAGITIKGGYIGDATQWLLTDVVEDSTTLDGNNKGRVIDLTATTDTFNILNIVLKNGSVSGTNNYGGALRIGHGSNLILGGRSKFINNTSALYGGAFTFQQSNVLIQDSVLFEGNSAKMYGGAILADNGILTITDCVTFIGNSSAPYSGCGGAIYIETGTLNLSGNVLFKNNSAGVGGAICSGATVTITDSVIFQNNRADEGSAIFQDGVLYLSGNVKILNSIFLYDDKIIYAPNGALGIDAVIDTIIVADPAAGRVVVHYSNYQPTPLSGTALAATEELAKYSFLDNSGYKLYNGANPNVVLTYSSTMVTQYKPDSYDIVMTNATNTLSFNAYATIPSGATSVKISSDGVDSTLLADTTFALSGTLFRYTQALPGNTYTFLFNDSNASTYSVEMAAAPTFATALASTNINVALPQTAVDTIQSVTKMNNLRLAVQPNVSQSTGAQLLVTDSLLLYDALSIEMNLNSFVNNGSASLFAFITLPFDLDLHTGIRFVPTDISKAGGGNRSELLARLNVDYLIRLYSSALRSENGQGNQNWVDITSLPYNGSEVILKDGHIIPAGTGFIMLIVNNSFYGTDDTYPTGAGPLNNSYRFYANNPNVLGADISLQIGVVSNGASSLQRHSRYADNTWQRTWDDGLVLVGVPQTSSYAYHESSNLPRYLYHRSADAQNGDFLTIDTEIYNAQPYTAYYAFMTPTALAVSETQNILFTGYGDAPATVVDNYSEETDERFIFSLLKDNVQQDMVGLYFNNRANHYYVRNQDAVKMGTNGTNIIWNNMAIGNFAFFTQPFVPDTMQFNIRVNTDSSSIYRIKPYHDLPQGYETYIQFSNDTTKHAITNNGYTLSEHGQLTLPLFIVKRSAVETESKGLNNDIIPMVYQQDGVLTIDRIAINTQVTLFSSMGKLLHSFVAQNTQVVIQHLPQGVYLLRLNNHGKCNTIKVIVQ